MTFSFTNNDSKSFFQSPHDSSVRSLFGDGSKAQLKVAGQEYAQVVEIRRSSHSEPKKVGLVLADPMEATAVCIDETTRVFPVCIHY